MVSVSPEEAKGTNLTNRREGRWWENRREVKGREGLVVLCLKETQKGFWDFEEMVERGGKGARMVGVLSTVAIVEVQRLREREREIRVAKL